ncbi:hypothetical protein L6164_019496 [Bauhinia variegata]|uniref:Uncharacterized protein n=1 Tax=Bauhinia variegata TaxID=167791 RepID=A0ACB9MTL0_BAUVA|nr:hypothetical protein L6164_019496 [Bauhinia variegata]
MSYLGNLLLWSLLLLSLSMISSDAANFEIVNNCPYNVWAAASPGGGRRLDRGQTWNLWVAPGTVMARIWGRTGCNFDASGNGRCQTGDCTGGLQCTDGFNIPMDFYPLNGECHKISCTADINGQCPNELRKAEWNETFVFNISGGVSELKLKIMDSDSVTADDLVGEVSISLEGAFSEVTPSSYNVERCERGFHEEGYRYGGWKESGNLDTKIEYNSFLESRSAVKRLLAVDKAYAMRSSHWNFTIKLNSDKENRVEY